MRKFWIVAGCLASGLSPAFGQCHMLLAQPSNPIFPYREIIEVLETGTPLSASQERQVQQVLLLLFDSIFAPARATFLRNALRESPDAKATLRNLNYDGPAAQFVQQVVQKLKGEGDSLLQVVRHIEAVHFALPLRTPLFDPHTTLDTLRALQLELATRIKEGSLTDQDRERIQGALADHLLVLRVDQRKAVLEHLRASFLSPNGTPMEFVARLLFHFPLGKLLPFFTQNTLPFH